SYYSLLFFPSRRRHTRFSRDWSSDVCSSDLAPSPPGAASASAAPKYGAAAGPNPSTTTPPPTAPSAIAPWNTPASSDEAASRACGADGANAATVRRTDRIAALPAAELPTTPATP